MQCSLTRAATVRNGCPERAASGAQPSYPTTVQQVVPASTNLGPALHTLCAVLVLYQLERVLLALCPRAVSMCSTVWLRWPLHAVQLPLWPDLVTYGTHSSCPRVRSCCGCQTSLSGCWIRYAGGGWRGVHGPDPVHRLVPCHTFMLCSVWVRSDPGVVMRLDGRAPRGCVWHLHTKRTSLP